MDAHVVGRKLRTGQTYRWRYPTHFAGIERVPMGTVRRVKPGRWYVAVDGETPRTVQAANVHSAIKQSVAEDT